MLEIGSLVDGKYKILNKVGQGGMSVVYLAMNEKANKQWAVKEVRKDGIKDFEVVKQGLVAETDILKKLNHPNLPSIIDVIDTDDSFIIIMDYIQGNSLNKALDEFGAQPQEHVISWAKQLCDVLGYLHSRNPAIIYRDMKPANVMLKPDGNVTLIDFGTAREFKEKNLADTTCLGTVGYAAPEQFGGMGQTDARTDIYCLGATLYHLVTGMNPCEPPYEIKPIREINPSLSGGLERIILKCTQRDPNDRYQSAEELMYALEHYEEIDDIYRKKQQRKLGTFIATLSLAVVFGITGAWGYFSAESALKQNYNAIVKSAGEITDTGERFQKYVEAIRVDPTREEAYLELSESFFGDFVLDANEKALLDTLLKLDTNPANDNEGTEGSKQDTLLLDLFKNANKDEHSDLCFDIGRYLLNFYKPEERYKAALEYFKRIREDDNSNGKLADILCELSDCKTKIGYLNNSGLLQGDELATKYTEMWTLLKGLHTNVDGYSDEHKIFVLKDVVGEITSNDTALCEKVPNAREEMITLLQDVENYAAQVSSTSKEVTEAINELRKAVADELKRIETIK